MPSVSNDTTVPVVVAEFVFEPEQTAEALALLAAALPDTRRFEGCQMIETLVDLDRPGQVVLLQRWASRAAHAAYLAWRQESGTSAQLVDLFAARPRFRYCEARPDI